MDQGLATPNWLRRTAERIIRACEIGVVAAAQFLVIASVVVATIVIYDLFVLRSRTESLLSIDSLGVLQQDVEQVFGGVLLLLLGLELLKTLTSFFKGHRFQLEVIVVVAMIAVTRHIMLMDFAHIDALSVFGAAALILALAVSYWLVRQPGQSPEA